ncbi:DDE_3 domain-containing protein [Trichonephila clavipes]|nr:DDE_3 domain-containing protein [Trichonephila clavipes]
MIEDRAIRRVATLGTNNVASIDSTPLTSFQTSSAIKRNHKETTDRSWLEEPTSAKTLPLTPHHRQFSVLITTAHVRLRRTGQRSDPGIYCRAAYSNLQGVTVWGAISWDTRSSLVVLQGTLTARRYVDDILTPIVLPMLSSHPGAIYQQDNARPHTARLPPNNVFKDITSYHGLPGHQIFSPIEHASGDALGRQLQPSRDTWWRINCADAKTMAVWIFHRGS